MNGVYDRIRQLRIANGLTLEELARAVGYSDKSMMGHIEHGKVDLPLSRVAAIAQALHTTPQGTAVPQQRCVRLGHIKGVVHWTGSAFLWVPRLVHKY